MNKKFNSIIFALFFGIVFSNCTSNQNQSETKMQKAESQMFGKIKNFAAPICEKNAKELSIHGDTRIDNYYWLNDRENQKTIDYLNAENTYTDSILGHTKAFQEKLYEEMVGRIKKDDQSVPYKNNGYWYYTRYEKGGEYPIYCRKKESLDSEEEIMLNVNEMAEGHEFYQVGGLSVSQNNKMISFGVDTVSRRKYTIHFKNLETGEILNQTIENTTGYAPWANDNKTIFYTSKDEETLRSDRIFRYNLDKKVKEEVYHEADETYVCFVYKSKSKKFIIIGSSSTLSTEYRVLNANTPDSDFQVFEPRGKKHEYNISHFNDKFYIITNWEAKNFRLMETPDDQLEKENWKEVIAHREDVLLENIEIFKNHLVVDERKNGLTQLRIINQTDQSEHYMDFGEEVYTGYISTNPEFDTEILRYGYSSMTTPNSTFDYDMNAKTKKLLKQQAVLDDNFKPENYEAKRLYATADDGTKIPISLVYKKGMELNGENPLLLYGYGSYGATIDPYFSSTRLTLLDRGFVFAIAHIRGGKLMGEHWYEDGKMFKKKNTFTDFIDCGEFLIEQKYTSSNHLYALGGSAGGLLMGAIINIKPELFNGVIAAVPFVDVVTTMLDETIPLTTGEFDEWGNPKNKDSYEYMKSYSPYDNVEAKAYPNLLVTTGLHDSQVQYWEPAKWVAKLREMKTDENALLLHTNMEAGHGGASGRFQRLKETAMEYAFFFDLEGISE